MQRSEILFFSGAKDPPPNPKWGDITNTLIVTYWKATKFTMAVHDWITGSPGPTGAPLLFMIGKHFLFVTTGVGMPKVKQGDSNHAQPMDDKLSITV